MPPPNDDPVWYLGGRSLGYQSRVVNNNAVQRRDYNYSPWQSLDRPDGRFGYPGHSTYPRYNALGAMMGGYHGPNAAYQIRRPQSAPPYETRRLGVHGIDRGRSDWFHRDRYLPGYSGWRTATPSPVRAANIAQRCAERRVIDRDIWGVGRR